MTITILCLFPEIVEQYFARSIMARAVEKGIIQYRLVNIRDYAENKHRTVDDSPYGGGPGMILMPDPLARALEASLAACAEDAQAKDSTAEANTAPALSRIAVAQGARVLYPSPSGRPLSEGMVQELSGEEHLVLVCGRYEGIDQRIIDEYVDDEISIGDYVLSSGEIASLVIIDSVFRKIDGVINARSLEEESFADGRLEYPQYTRPRVFRNYAVPQVLLSGNHEDIRKWRRKEGLRKTMRMRSEIVESIALTAEDTVLLQEILEEEGHESHASN